MRGDQRHDLPLENLLTPDILRRLAWDATVAPDRDAIAAFLTDRGARPWQLALTAQALAEALRAL